MAFPQGKIADTRLPINSFNSQAPTEPDLRFADYKTTNPCFNSHFDPVREAPTEPDIRRRMAVPDDMRLSNPVYNRYFHSHPKGDFRRAWLGK